MLCNTPPNTTRPGMKTKRHTLYIQIPTCCLQSKLYNTNIPKLGNWVMFYCPLWTFWVQQVIWPFWDLDFYLFRNWLEQMISCKSLPKVSALHLVQHQESCSASCSISYVNIYTTIYTRGVKLIFTGGDISLTVAFKGPNVI